MDARVHYRVLTLVLLLAAEAVTAAAAQQAGPLPEGVTSDMVAKGKGVFTGAGLCLACHGPDGKGTIGPDLTDKTWLHSDGSFDAIVKQVLHGVDQKASKSGQIMPPRGGSGISDAEVRAVSAYVWSLSHKK